MEKESKFISLAKVTVGQLSEILNEFREDGLIFRCDFSQISKNLLSKFLDVDAFSVDYPTLRDAFLKSIEFEELKKPVEEPELMKRFRKERIEQTERAILDEGEFHRYICVTYLT